MSLKVKAYNQEAEEKGEEKLPDNIFNIEINDVLIHQAMVTQTANERQVLAHTKDKSEVRGGGRKPWRQKGTGRARAGSTRSPIWIGGGVTFGPRKERNFKKKINRKMKQKAIFMVLSDRLKSNNFVLLDDLKFDEFKTKKAQDLLTKIEKKILKEKSVKNREAKDKKPKRSILVITDAKEDKTKYSLRNLAGAKLLNINNINILDLLKYRNLVITSGSIKILEKIYK